MKILGLIPARQGSVGVPGKNTKMIAGKPLLQWSFESAVASGMLDRIILSSDDPQAMDLARDIGLEVPFQRPPELARNNSSMLEVLQHALQTLGQTGYKPDALMLLQPTSPLRSAKTIIQAVSLLGDAHSVCSVTALPQTHCPHYVMKITDTGFLDYFLPEGKNYTRRQDVPQAYTRNGVVYLTRSEVIRGEHHPEGTGSAYGSNCVPLILSGAETISIDTFADWQMAETALSEIADTSP
jgi:CMP-N,N'-diacetyllegionaminic acid synthase